MSSLGPLPVPVVIAFAAIVPAWVLVRVWAGRLPATPDRAPHKAASALFLDALLIGLLAARLGYVLRWWSEYTVAPMAIIAIGDGGFLWWTGLPAAIAFAWWRTRKAPSLRRPVLAGMAAGMLAWGVFNGMLALLQRAAPQLSDVALATLDGASVRLDVYAGRPFVLNLWATWCPPCRREMPVFEDAQRRYPGVAFVLVNQGEDRDTIRSFLDRQGLDLRDVLRDAASRTMLDAGTRGLPTTLFFDAHGQLVDRHMGELTRASLADTLQRRFGERARVPPAPSESTRRLPIPPRSGDDAKLPE